MFIKIALLFCIFFIFITIFNKCCENSEKYQREQFTHYPILSRLKKQCSLLDNRVGNLDFLYSRDETYTDNKKKIYICLLNKDGRYYDFNTLMFVCIHEISHAISAEFDPEHTSKEFNDNFALLLNKAIDMNLYDPSKVMPPEYCGIKMKN